jgi:hypothetical protein
MRLPTPWPSANEASVSDDRRIRITEVKRLLQTGLVPRAVPPPRARVPRGRQGQARPLPRPPARAEERDARPARPPAARGAVPRPGSAARPAAAATRSTTRPAGTTTSRTRRRPPSSARRRRPRRSKSTARAECRTRIGARSMLWPTPSPRASEGPTPRGDALAGLAHRTVSARMASRHTFSPSTS